MTAARLLALFAVAPLLAGAALYAAAPAAQGAAGSAPATGAPGSAPAARGGRGLGGAGRGFGGGRGSILDQVAIQGGPNSQKAHEDLLAKAKLGKGKVDIYFEGDSIFRRWAPDPTFEPNYAKYYANWKENFWGWNAGDFAWGADTIQNILWRLRNGELDELNPKVVVFLGGTNNVTGSNNVDDMTKGLTACFDEIHKKAPDAVLIIVGILPRQANYQPTIDAINANLARLADGRKTRYVDLKEKFLDKDGKLIAGMLNNDSLHPDTRGYQAIADAIKPLLTEVLGPPAKDDHAPPPTWDHTSRTPGATGDYPPKPATASAPAQ
ncbi:MAG TPA: GDSL-type esterase/lipase family protein [Phycisphaerae bacterium]|jgi:lysophospholipase L1-like esterase|nr:GDSL-type esterase/lipase family protein [Phycisphaerae bacterium]